MGLNLKKQVKTEQTHIDSLWGDWPQQRRKHSAILTAGNHGIDRRKYGHRKALKVISQGGHEGTRQRWKGVFDERRFWNSSRASIEDNEEKWASVKFYSSFYFILYQIYYNF